MVLELEVVMDILKDENINEQQAKELATNLEVIAHHVIEELVKESLKNER